ncbi:hypothetical protein ACIGEZ_32375 [Streptomyces sp. NPDC085481]|uniref:hypothetical protein n=1 Tax=Streptomyces sp. NPDC085481 TaxID=3365727 RepID=UPI0037D6146C
MPQNVNGGKNPKPAPEREAPKPEFKDGKWEIGDGWEVIFAAQCLLSLLNGEQEEFSPEEVCSGGLLGFQCTAGGNLLDPETGVTYCNPAGG